MRREDWLVQQLPVGMTEDDFFVRFVSIFQHVASTVLDQVDTLPHLFDTAVAPDAQVRAIGSWVGLDWVDPTLPDAAQRRLVRGYCAGLPWRGTAQGLTRLLTLITGSEAEIEDTGGVFLEDEAPDLWPHVSIRLATSGRATVNDLCRIIRQELPATVTFDLSIDGQRVHPPRQESI
jgi:phage tail-like protein